MVQGDLGFSEDYQGLPPGASTWISGAARDLDFPASILPQAVRKSVATIKKSTAVWNRCNSTTLSRNNG
jgi:hypothetical protein